MNLPGVTRRHPRRRPMAEINVVPYIDVTLVLLIIFMITAPMLQMGVDVELPQAEARTIDASEQLPIIISINAGGALFLDIGNQGDTPVPDAELASRVQETLAKKPGLTVLIRGDRKVEYGRVVTVMAALKQAGIPSVGLMTRPADE
jgi:biopolymer transport protein TolR